MADTRPMCVPCQNRYYCKENGVYIRYGDHGVLSGDLWECPTCGHQMIQGFAAEALYTPPFDAEKVMALYTRAIAGD